MFKFLPALFILPIKTARLVDIVLNWPSDPQLIIVLIVFAFIIAILSTFWFASIVSNIHHSSHAKLQEKHAKDREKLLLKAEREKAKISLKNNKQIDQSTKNIIAKANFKVGLAVAAAVGIGGIMIISQLVTIGMMMLVASGSGLAGYLVRARQDRLDHDDNLTIIKLKQKTSKILSKPKNSPKLEHKH